MDTDPVTTDLDANFALARELCVRARSASPSQAVEYLEFIHAIHEKILADLKAMAVGKPEYDDEIQALERGLVLIALVTEMHESQQ